MKTLILFIIAVIISVLIIVSCEKENSPVATTSQMSGDTIFITDTIFVLQAPDTIHDTIIQWDTIINYLMDTVIVHDTIVDSFLTAGVFDAFVVAEFLVQRYFQNNTQYGWSHDYYFPAWDGAAVSASGYNGIDFTAKGTIKIIPYNAPNIRKKWSCELTFNGGDKYNSNDWDLINLEIQ